MPAQQIIKTLIGAIKDNGLDFNSENYDGYDECVKIRLKKWLDDNNWTAAGVPLDHLGLTSCFIASIESVKLYVFDFYYGGGDAAPDMCGGKIVLSSDGKVADLLLDTVECGE